jgi:hypothetical protein
MTEAELALHFIDYFSDYEIYKEVPCSTGRIDIYAIHSPIRIAIEVKKQFSTKLIMQAVQNKRYANYSFVAIPDLKGTYEGRQICRLLGIGVLMYKPVYSNSKDSPYEVKIIERPAYQRAIFKLKVLESMKDATAGAQHNDMSEFKVTVADMEMTIGRRGDSMPISELFKEPYHYQSPKHAKQAIVRLIKKGVLPQFKIDGGMISLQ